MKIPFRIIIALLVSISFNSNARTSLCDYDKEFLIKALSSCKIDHFDCDDRYNKDVYECLPENAVNLKFRLHAGFGMFIDTKADTYDYSSNLARKQFRCFSSKCQDIQ